MFDRGQHPYVLNADTAIAGLNVDLHKVKAVAVWSHRLALG